MTTIEDLRQKRIATPVLDDLESKRKRTMDHRLNHPTITELIWDRDYYVRAINLPRHIAGVSTASPDGTYNIYLNARLPIELQWEAFLHELLHCEAGHLDEWKDLPLEVKEWEADNLRPIIRGEDVS